MLCSRAVLYMEKNFSVREDSTCFSFLMCYDKEKCIGGEKRTMSREKYQSTVLGREIRKFRIRNHITQKTLGDRIGVSGNTIHLWETRIVKPNVIYLLQLSRVMDQPLSNLIEYATLLWNEEKKDD